MARQRPRPIEESEAARELSRLVGALPKDRRDVLMAELRDDVDDKFAPDVSFAVSLSERSDGYWYATCSYAGKSFSAYVGKQRDEARAATLLRGKVQAWVRKRES